MCLWRRWKRSREKEETRKNTRSDCPRINFLNNSGHALLWTWRRWRPGRSKTIEWSWRRSWRTGCFWLSRYGFSGGTPNRAQRIVRLHIISQPRNIKLLQSFCPLHMIMVFVFVLNKNLHGVNQISAVTFCNYFSNSDVIVQGDNNSFK